MSDPLPLTMPAPPALPGRIRPEAAVPCAAPFDHPDFRFSVDWDGARTLLFAADEGVRLQAETLADVSHRYPEIVSAAGSLAGRSAVLDGIVTVLDPSGCPDLAAFGARQAAGAAAQHRLPAVYLAIDILHLEGAATMSLPLDRRLELLGSLHLAGARIQAPDWVAGQGEDLAEAAAARRLPALLARRADVPYHPGIASPHRLRIAMRSRADCVVLGADRVERRERPRRRRLRLGEYCDGRLIGAGAVEIAETDPLWGWVAPGGRLRSGLVASVEHLGRRTDGTLRDPSLLTLRDDVDPRWCLCREPVPAPRGPRLSGVSGFRPTVLSPLPLG